MTIEYRDYADNNGRRDTIMVSCPKCGEPLDEGEGFAHHWPSCPGNPAATVGDDAG
jgi:ssDNA-binding Zn-finger/Zn-ribbon topoisomerase 1